MPKSASEMTIEEIRDSFHAGTLTWEQLDRAEALADAEWVASEKSRDASWAMAPDSGDCSCDDDAM